MVTYSCMSTASILFTHSPRFATACYCSEVVCSLRRELHSVKCYRSSSMSACSRCSTSYA
jgi:hypothetical protein